MRSIAVLAVAVSLVLTACSHGDKGDDAPPTPSPIRPSPVRSPTPAVIGTQDVADWAAVWKAAFQRFADDVSALVQAAGARDLDGMRAALARMPGDAHDAVQKIDEAGAAPPGFQDEVARLRGLAGQAASSAGWIGADCLSEPGLPCAADVATLLSVAGQVMNALKPFGVDINFHIDI